MSRAKSGKEVAKPKLLEESQEFSINDHRYWLARVYLPSYSKKGSTREASVYAVRIQAHGERRGVSLGKTKKREAAKAALQLCSWVKSDGWEIGLAKFRGKLPPMRGGLTLGDYLNEVADTGLVVPRTYRTYVCKVRRIAADIGRVRLPKGVNKHDHVNGGSQQWQIQVDRIPIDSFTVENLTKWRADYLAQFRDNPARLQSAIRTANSCIRAGKALFKEEIRNHLSHLKLPDPPPFVGIKTAKESPNRYRSEIENPEVLLVAGKRELAEATAQSEWAASWRESGGEGEPPKPSDHDMICATARAERRQQAYKILVLGLVAGLRRAEIDRLQWSQIDFERSEIRIEATDCFAPKADSKGDIPIEPEVAELLKQWKQNSNDRFVVSGVKPINKTDQHHYRADRSHRELVTWLHSKGITARNPIHALRKEFGSLVCAKAGIYVASRLLRHASITTTAAVYTDDRGRVTSGLGSAIGV